MTEALILRELLAAEPDWVSGGAIAAKLGVSRVSIWHQMEKLRAQGFEFEALPARGYRLSGRPGRCMRRSWRPSSGSAGRRSRS